MRSLQEDLQRNLQLTLKRMSKVLATSNPPNAFGGFDVAGVVGGCAVALGGCAVHK